MDSEGGGIAKLTMERIDPKTVLPLLKAEHAHRYMWAARGARGHVLDAACGVGYGSPILQNNAAVTAYTGLDNSPDALAYAVREYAGKRRTFVCGDVYQLPFEDATFDSVVSLETIEHLEHPERAIAEFARVLKPDGVLLGSVPQKEFEDLCTAAYGPNEFHKSQFDRANLERLIKSSFESYSVWTCWLSVTSILAPLDSMHRSAELEQQSDWGSRLGSLLFAATRGKALLLPGAESTSLLPAVDLVTHERATITWRDRAIANQTKMIDERDNVIKSMEQRLENKKAENTAQSRLVDERDRLIRENELRLEAKRAENVAQARLVDERDRIIRENSAMIEGKSREIAAQTKMIQERDGIIAKHAANAQSISKLLQEREEQLAQRNDSIAKLTQELQAAKNLQSTTVQQLSSVQAECATAVGQLAAVRSQLSEIQERYSRSELQVKRLGDERDVATTQLKAVSARLAEHEGLVKSQSDLIVKRAAFIKHLEFLIVDRDKAIIDMTKMIDERTDLIRKQDIIVASRDAAIQSQLMLLSERETLIAEQSVAISSLESQLGNAHALVGSLQISLAGKTQDVGMLEQRINSLGGSLSMVRKELRSHLSDLERPAFCLRQTTRALVGLVRYDRTDGREGRG